MATDSPQRSYRAPCPGCGAPVEFRSAQSIRAVCAYCHSTVLRSGDTLSRIGKMAELFDDFSPLQLMASGVWQVDGKSLAFTLAVVFAQVGRAAVGEHGVPLGPAALGVLVLKPADQREGQ